MIAATHPTVDSFPEANGEQRRPWRATLALLSTVLLLGLVATTFWYQDWRYSLPTPRPSGLEQLALGARVPDSIRAELGPDDGRPVFLHFTSPFCPCSRFVLDHVRELVRAHGREVRFVAVVRPEDDSEAEPLAPDLTGLGIEQVADVGGRIAAGLGVYATPQAVVVARDGALWYRGNYNASRYCTSPGSAFARLALEALLGGVPRPAVPEAAARAYGCALPARRPGGAG